MIVSIETYANEKASQAVITPVEPCRPVPTQLSLSLTRSMPANLRFASFWLAVTSGSEQSMRRLFASDLPVLYTVVHDFLPNSRTSIRT